MQDGCQGSRGPLRGASAVVVEGPAKLVDQRVFRRDTNTRQENDATERQGNVETEHLNTGQRLRQVPPKPTKGRDTGVVCEGNTAATHFIHKNENLRDLQT